MRFFVGALALAVLCALLGAPTAMVLGWAPLSTLNRQNAAKGAAAPASKATGETGVTVRRKGTFS